MAKTEFTAEELYVRERVYRASQERKPLGLDAEEVQALWSGLFKSAKECMTLREEVKRREGMDNA